MAYCALADVQAINPKRAYNTTSTPTSTQVTTLINQVAGEIDAYLKSKGYDLDNLSVTMTDYLKSMNAYGAAALAEMGMFPEISEKGSTPHWKVLWDKYHELLYNIYEPLDNHHVGSYYTDVADQNEYPDPAFRKSSDDKEF